MKTQEAKSAIVVRGLLGILASVALTVGAALGIAFELERGFQPMYEAMGARQQAADRAERMLPGTANVSRVAAAKLHGG